MMINWTHPDFLFQPFFPKGSKFELLEEEVEPAVYCDKLLVVIFADIDVLSVFGSDNSEANNLVTFYCVFGQHL